MDALPIGCMMLEAHAEVAELAKQSYKLKQEP